MPTENAPRIRSINVGKPKDRDWAGIGFTSIEKHALDAPVRARRLGLDGDQVSDTEHHGGVDQAVYAFAREELDWWAAELDQEIRDGQFAENLTTEGITLEDAEVGERWRVGTTLLEVASVRIPCNDFKNWQRVNGYDDTAWVKRFTAHGRPGAYLRVVEEGELRVGDALEVVHRPGHGVTVATMFRALTTERSLLPELLKVDALAEAPRRLVEKYVVRI